MRHHSKSGFTLVELLVVITIIGVLVALLLPAVQSARESGRNTQCQNNLKSIALACIHHEQAQGFLPTGGWGASWAGDPNRGFSANQPGGWIFNILPYLDQKALHDLALTDPNQMTTTMQMALPVLHCSTRRRAILYPFLQGVQFANLSQQPKPPAGSASAPIGRTDYAANAGDLPPDNVQGGTASATSYPLWPNAPLGGGTATGLTPVSGPSSGTPTDPYGNGDGAANWSIISQDAVNATGVMYIHSQIRLVQISDGMGKTYLCGERYMCPDFYMNGQGPDDNLGWDTGYSENTFRWTSQYAVPSSPGSPAGSVLLAGILVGTYNPPTQNATVASQYVPARDTPGRDASYVTSLQTVVSGFTANRNFGSAHPTSFNMAFCDGSVHPVRFSVDPLTHQYLGNRQDQLILPGMTGSTANPYPTPVDSAKYLP